MPPISFLPQDTITPAIQNLGQSLSAISQRKMAQQQGIIDQYMKLVDVSLEGTQANHRDEILGDLDTFKQKAADVFVKAEQNNAVPNYKDLTAIEQDKKSILTKVTDSQLLVNRYKQAMLYAAELKKKGELAPSSEAALNDWVTTKTPIAKAADPMTLIDTQYTPEKAMKIEKEWFRDNQYAAQKTGKMTPRPDGSGYDYTYGVYDEGDVQRDAGNLWDSDKDLQNYWKERGVDRSTYITRKQQTETMGMQLIKQKAGFGKVQPSTGWTQFDNSDGTTTYTPQVLIKRPLTYADGTISDTQLLKFVEDKSTGKRIWYGTRMVKVPKDATQQYIADNPKKYPGIKVETKEEEQPVKIDETTLSTDDYNSLQAYYPKDPGKAKKVSEPTVGSLKAARTQNPGVSDADLIKLYKDQHNIDLK